MLEACCAVSRRFSMFVLPPLFCFQKFYINQFEKIFNAMLSQFVYLYFHYLILLTFSFSSRFRGWPSACLLNCIMDIKALLQLHTRGESLLHFLAIYLLNIKTVILNCLHGVPPLNYVFGPIEQQERYTTTKIILEERKNWTSGQIITLMK